MSPGDSGGGSSVIGGVGGSGLAGLIPSSAASSSASSVRLCDDAYSYTNSSIGTTSSTCTAEDYAAQRGEMEEAESTLVRKVGRYLGGTEFEFGAEFWSWFFNMQKWCSDECLNSTRRRKGESWMRRILRLLET
jgi:hypothetical protein